MHAPPSLLAAVVVLVTSSCGPPRARTDPGGGQVAADGDSATSPPAACPATYAETPLGQACTDTAAACTYPEGRCWCGPRGYCGGAAPPPDLLDELARPAWQCEAARTDGCPEVQPTGACTEDGKVCGYGDCCVYVLTCQAGAWVHTGGGCPP